MTVWVKSWHGAQKLQHFAILPKVTKTLLFWTQKQSRQIKTKMKSRSQKPWKSLFLRVFSSFLSIFMTFESQWIHILMYHMISIKTSKTHDDLFDQKVTIFGSFWHQNHSKPVENRWSKHSFNVVFYIRA